MIGLSEREIRYEPALFTKNLLNKETIA